MDHCAHRSSLSQAHQPGTLPPTKRHPDMQSLSAPRPRSRPRTLPSLCIALPPTTCLHPNSHLPEAGKNPVFTGLSRQRGTTPSCRVALSAQVPLTDSHTRYLSSGLPGTHSRTHVHTDTHGNGNRALSPATQPQERPCPTPSSAPTRYPTNLTHHCRLMWVPQSMGPEPQTGLAFLRKSL